MILLIYWQESKNLFYALLNVYWTFIIKVTLYVIIFLNIFHFLLLCISYLKKKNASFSDNFSYLLNEGPLL